MTKTPVWNLLLWPAFIFLAIGLFEVNRTAKELNNQSQAKMNTNTFWIEKIIGYIEQRVPPPPATVFIGTNQYQLTITNDAGAWTWKLNGL